MLNSFYNMSNLSLAILVAVTLVGFSWAGVFFIRPFFEIWMRGQTRRNALIGYTISCISVFYGLLLGLLSVATYQNTEDVENMVKNEATTLATLYRDVSHYPGHVKYFLQDQIKNYTLYTIDEVWPAQQNGKTAKYDNIIVSNIQDNLISFKPETRSDEILHAETLRRFNAFIEARQSRQAGVDKSIPLVLWYVVGVGALMNIGLFWLFDMKLSIHLILGGSVAFFLSMMIFVIIAMDAPLRGEVSVPPAAYAKVFKNLMQ